MRRFPAASHSLAIAVLVALLVRPALAPAQPPVVQPINPDRMLPVELAGFGDPANTWVGSMKWFKEACTSGLSARSTACSPPPSRLCWESTSIRRPSSTAKRTRATSRSPQKSGASLPPTRAGTWFSDRPRTCHRVQSAGRSHEVHRAGRRVFSMEIHVERDGTEVLYVGGTSAAGSSPDF
jgi:hypothetical protein